MRNLVALIFPIAIAALLTGFVSLRNVDVVDDRLSLQRLEVESAADLEAIFEAMGYSWPPKVVPAVELQALPSDLADVADVKLRKTLFFRALLPIVLAENAMLEEVRNHIIKLLGKGVQQLSSAERRWLESVADQYKVDGDIASENVQRLLLRRVDVVPPSLVLAQAANESAWGTSRFALNGNNLFGQWTYKLKGIVPMDRAEGANHSVRVFSSLDDSVRAYIHNINTNLAYTELREMRQQMRSNGERLSGHQLAEGLQAYSARGDAYVDEIQSMIRSNQLPSLLKGVSLFPSDS